MSRLDLRIRENWLSLYFNSSSQSPWKGEFHLKLFYSATRGPSPRSALVPQRTSKERKKKKKSNVLNSRRASSRVRGARILSLAIRRIGINAPRQGSGASRREVVLTSSQERYGRVSDRTFDGREWCSPAVRKWANKTNRVASDSYAANCCYASGRRRFYARRFIYDASRRNRIREITEQSRGMMLHDSRSTARGERRDAEDPSARSRLICSQRERERGVRREGG